MITATRRLQFAIGHRVHRHESKCSNFHGHNYVFHFHACAAELDSIGRVIDFSVLKAKLGGWLELHWDHGFLVWDKDEEALAALRMVGGKRFVAPFNPTAENMADFLLRRICPEQLEGTHVLVYKVVVEETENCFATAELNIAPLVVVEHQKENR